MRVRGRLDLWGEAHEKSVKVLDIAKQQSTSVFGAGALGNPFAAANPFGASPFGAGDMMKNPFAVSGGDDAASPFVRNPFGAGNPVTNPFGPPRTASGDEDDEDDDGGNASDRPNSDCSSSVDSGRSS